MLAVLHSLGMFVIDLFKSRHRLEAENLFLRHQLSIAFDACAAAKCPFSSSNVCSRSPVQSNNRSSEAAAGTQGEFISLVWCGRHPDIAHRDQTGWLGIRLELRNVVANYPFESEFRPQRLFAFELRRWGYA